MPRIVIKIISAILIIVIFFQQSGFAQTCAEMDLSSYFSKFNSQTRPIVTQFACPRYLRFDNDGKFNLLLEKDNGSEFINNAAFNNSRFMLDYFITGLRIPNYLFCVNLRPDEPENIINFELSRTEVGRIILEADLQLKKIAARLTSLNTQIGMQYWEKIYKKAAELFSIEELDNLTIPSFVRPWIVPSEIIIRETPNSVYVYKAVLKVMLEDDYLNNSLKQDFGDLRKMELNQYSAQIFRELVIPELNKAVNSSAIFAGLRQVYYSLIISQWFKKHLSGIDLTRNYLIDSSIVGDLQSANPIATKTCYDEYMRSFKEGEYNVYVPQYTAGGMKLRSYLSGGISLSVDIPEHIVPPGFVRSFGNLTVIGGDMFNDKNFFETGMRFRADQNRYASSSLNGGKKFENTADNLGQSIEIENTEKSWSKGILFLLTALFVYFSSAVNAFGAQIIKNTQGVVRIVVEKGDTVGHIVLQLRKAGIDGLDGKLWGPNGAVERFWKIADSYFGSADVNVINYGSNIAFSPEVVEKLSGHVEPIVHSAANALPVIVAQTIPQTVNAAANVLTSPVGSPGVFTAIANPALATPVSKPALYPLASWLDYVFDNLFSDLFNTVISFSNWICSAWYNPVIFLSIIVFSYILVKQVVDSLRIEDDDIKLSWEEKMIESLRGYCSQDRVTSESTRKILIIAQTMVTKNYKHKNLNAKIYAVKLSEVIDIILNKIKTVQNSVEDSQERRDLIIMREEFSRIKEACLIQIRLGNAWHALDTTQEFQLPSLQTVKKEIGRIPLVILRYGAYVLLYGLYLPLFVIAIGLREIHGMMMQYRFLRWFILNQSAKLITALNGNNENNGLKPDFFNDPQKDIKEIEARINSVAKYRFKSVIDLLQRLLPKNLLKSIPIVLIVNATLNYGGSIHSAQGLFALFLSGITKAYGFSLAFWWLYYLLIDLICLAPVTSGIMFFKRKIRHMDKNYFNLTHSMKEGWFLESEYKKTRDMALLEKTSEEPTADLVIFMHDQENKKGKMFEESIVNKRQLFRDDVPVLFLDSKGGSTRAFLEALHWLHNSNNFSGLLSKYPRLHGKLFHELRIIVVLAGGHNFEQLVNAAYLKDGLSAVELSLLNGYKITRNLADENRGGVAVIFGDGMYMSPFKRESDITFLGSWSSLEQVDIQSLGVLDIDFSDNNRVAGLFEKADEPVLRKKLLNNNLNWDSKESKQLVALTGGMVFSFDDKDKFGEFLVFSEGIRDIIISKDRAIKNVGLFPLSLVPSVLVSLVRKKNDKYTGTYYAKMHNGQDVCFVSGADYYRGIENYIESSNGLFNTIGIGVNLGYEHESFYVRMDGTDFMRRKLEYFNSAIGDNIAKVPLGNESNSVVSRVSDKQRASSSLAGVDFRDLNSANEGFDDELERIELLVMQVKVIPSPQRVNEYIKTESGRSNFSKKKPRLIGCIARAIKLEEERMLPTEYEFKQMLAGLELN
jgi:hypothetical protein